MAKLRYCGISGPKENIGIVRICTNKLFQKKNTQLHSFSKHFLKNIFQILYVIIFANNQIRDPLPTIYLKTRRIWVSFNMGFCISLIQSLSFSWNCSAKLVEGLKKRADEIRSNLNLCWDAMRTLNPCPRTG